MPNDWREKHFGIPEGPKRLSDRGTPEPTARWPYLVLALLVISPIAAVGVAYYLGKFDPPPPQVVDRPVVVENRVVENRVVVRETEKPRPSTQQSIPTDRRPTITQARANELQRLIESRERGLDLLSRDHAKAKTQYLQAERSLAAARAQVASLENSRPSASNSSGAYQWSTAYNNATSALSTASAEYRRQKSQNDSFEARILKATKERDDAQTILKTHDIETP
jgi:chromosome segregation ATPase